MSIRYKALTVIGITFAVLFAALAIISQEVLLTSYESLEQQDAHQNVVRIQNSITNQLNAMVAINGDWANWDDSYNFVQGNYPDYVDINLYDETLVNLNINLMVYLDTSNNVVFKKAVDITEGIEVDLPADFDSFLISDSPLVGLAEDAEPVKGFIQTSDGLMMISARPILTSDTTGPSMGTLIFGRLINDIWVERLSESLGLQIDLHSLDNGQVSESINTAVAALQQAPIFIQTLNNDTIAGYTSLNDLYGNHIVVVAVSLPRTIYNQGLNTVSLLAILLIGVGAVLSTVILVLLSRLVLSRVTNLSAEVDSIQVSGKLTKRVTVTSDDELALLARNINGMIERLDESQGELTRKNSALGLAYEEAQEANRLKSEFLSTMSHELRTPLNVIIGYSGLMIEGISGNLEPSAKRMVGNIHDSSKHLLMLINNILDLARIEAGRLEIVDEEYSIREIVQKLEQQLGVLAQQKGLVFDVNFDQNLPKLLLGDKERLTQVIINLLSNAVKFTKKGGVSFSVMRESDNMVIRVRDTGAGIPPHALDYIFEEFRQVDGTTTRTHEGTGLGLAIVRKLVTAMGGKITVESTVNVGSVFTVTMPLRVSTTSTQTKIPLIAKQKANMNV